MSKLEFYEYLLKLESQASSLLDSLSLLSNGKNSRIEHARRRAFARWSKRYDARRNHEEFFSNVDKLQIHSGDSVRLPASASEAANHDRLTGQGGNQTPNLLSDCPYFCSDCPTPIKHCIELPLTQTETVISKQQCKNHTMDELFCCCDDCVGSFVPPIYSLEYLEFSA